MNIQSLAHLVGKNFVATSATDQTFKLIHRSTLQVMQSAGGDLWDGLHGKTPSLPPPPPPPSFAFLHYWLINHSQVPYRHPQISESCAELMIKLINYSSCRCSACPGHGPADVHYPWSRHRCFLGSSLPPSLFVGHAGAISLCSSIEAQQSRLPQIFCY